MKTPPPPRNTIARKPSHFGSKRNPSPCGISSASLDSIGSTGGSSVKRLMPDPPSCDPLERPLHSQKRRNAIRQTGPTDGKAHIEIDQQPRREVRFQAEGSTGRPEGRCLKSEIARRPSRMIVPFARNSTSPTPPASPLAKNWCVVPWPPIAVGSRK